MARSESYSDALRRLVRALNETPHKIRCDRGSRSRLLWHPKNVNGHRRRYDGEPLSNPTWNPSVRFVKKRFHCQRGRNPRAVTGGELKSQAFDDRTGFLRVDMFLDKILWTGGGPH